MAKKKKVKKKTPAKKKAAGKKKVAKKKAAPKKKAKKKTGAEIKSGAPENKMQKTNIADDYYPMSEQMSAMPEEDIETETDLEESTEYF